ncbi:MAG TPA: DNA primase [Thermoflexus sp.]|nr:DNA primase [Thermoflexus sp.]
MSLIEEIKSRLDIVEIIGESVKLRRSGKNYVGFCPFHHNVRTPAFVVFPDTQTWRCFGACNTGGDIFQFIMRRDGLTFTEALRALANRAGIPLEPKTPEAEARERERARLREALAAAALFYQHQLRQAPEAEPARAYLAARGLTPETIERFALGYSPSAWHALIDYMLRRGFSMEELQAAGLVVLREDGTAFDRFRGRLMIPIRDPQGHVIGFGARTLGDEEPKYLNSPQTLLFDKSAVLFALDLARAEIRRTGVAVIVEGYFDAMMAHQAGFTNVVAALGTSLSEAQLRLLARSKRLVLALDADPAGMHAVLRGLASARQAFPETTLEFGPQGLIRLSGQLGVDLRVLTLPEGVDPDELIRRDPQEWARAVESARPVIAFLLDYLAGQHRLEDPKGKAGFVREVVPILAAIPDPVERDVYIQQAARMARLNERVLLEQVTSYRMSGQERRPRKGSAALLPSSGQKPMEGSEAIGSGMEAEATLLAMLSLGPDLLPYLNVRFAELGLEPLSEEDFLDSAHRVLFRNLTELGPIEDWPEEERGTPGGGSLLRALWVQLIQRREPLLRGFDPEDERWAEEALRLALWLREQRLKEILEDLQALTESMPDWPQEEFMAKWQTLKEELTQVQRFRYRRWLPDDRLSTVERR